MTELEAKRVTVPFGVCRGWPLEAVQLQKPVEWRRLCRMQKSGLLYGLLAEAMTVLAVTDNPTPRRRKKKAAADPWLAWAMR